MASIFSTIKGLPSRYSLKGAVNMSDVLNSAPPLGDDLEPLDYEFEQRDASKRPFTLRNQLTNQMDILQLNLYCMEFRGDGDRARKDNGFLAKMMLNQLKRRNSLFEGRVLVAFCVKSQEKDFNTKIRLWRKNANDYWKTAFKQTDLLYSNRTIYDVYRLYRINVLKTMYGDDWENYIWRILDVDEIGQYFNEEIPTYKSHEEMAMS